MEISIEMNMHELINNIEKKINTVPKELNNLKTKGIHVFIYSLKKSQLKDPLSDLTPFNKFMLIINELTEIINDIDYILGEKILNNEFLTSDTINYIYNVRLEFCFLNKKILNMVKLLKELNNETYIEYINILKNMILNIFININKNICINSLMEKLINNLESLKLIEFKFIKEFSSKITIVNEFLNTKIVDENLLLKLLNLTINVSIHGHIIEILGYFKLFMHLIIINELDNAMINIYLNILSYLNNFSKSINVNYSINEIIGNTIIKYNNSIV